MRGSTQSVNCGDVWPDRALAVTLVPARRAADDAIKTRRFILMGTSIVNFASTGDITRGQCAVEPWRLVYLNRPTACSTFRESLGCRVELTFATNWRSLPRAFHHLRAVYAVVHADHCVFCPFPQGDDGMYSGLRGPPQYRSRNLTCEQTSIACRRWNRFWC